MTTNPQDIASIAAGLSDAQRRWITCDRFQDWGAQYHHDLAQRGLVIATSIPSHLTRKGLAVRDYLQEQNNEG